MIKFLFGLVVGIGLLVLAGYFLIARGEILHGDERWPVANGTIHCASRLLAASVGQSSEG